MHKRGRQQESFLQPAAKRGRFTGEMAPLLVSIVNTNNLMEYIPKSVRYVEDKNLLCRVLAQMVKLNNVHRSPQSCGIPHENIAKIDPHPRVVIHDHANTEDEEADARTDHYYCIHMIFPCLVTITLADLVAIHQVRLFFPSPPPLTLFSSMHPLESLQRRFVKSRG